MTKSEAFDLLIEYAELRKNLINNNNMLTDNQKKEAFRRERPFIHAAFWQKLALLNLDKIDGTLDQICLV